MNIKLAIVVSEFNQEITDKLLEGALSRAREKGLDEKAIFVMKVPGAVEIPLMAQWLAKKEQYDTIICLGAVIRGETGHYDYVCQQVSYGCQRVMLDFNLPIIFGVLTTDNLEQAKARAGGRKGNKGVDAVDTVINILELRRQFFSSL